MTEFVVRAIYYLIQSAPAAYVLTFAILHGGGKYEPNFLEAWVGLAFVNWVWESVVFSNELLGKKITK